MAGGKEHRSSGRLIEYALNIGVEYTVAWVSAIQRRERSTRAIPTSSSRPSLCHLSFYRRVVTIIIEPLPGEMDDPIAIWYEKRSEQRVPPV